MTTPVSRRGRASDRGQCAISGLVRGRAERVAAWCRRSAPVERPSQPSGASSTTTWQYDGARNRTSAALKSTPPLPPPTMVRIGRSAGNKARPSSRPTYDKVGELASPRSTAAPPSATSATPGGRQTQAKQTGVGDQPRLHLRRARPHPKLRQDGATTTTYTYTYQGFGEERDRGVFRAPRHAR